MSSDLWWGAALSVPIGIGTALVTPVIQRKWDEASRSRDVERSRRTTLELQRIEFFVNNPHSLTQYLIMAGIKAAIVSASMIVLATLPNSLAQIMNIIPFGGLFFETQRNILFLLSQLTALVGSVVLINIYRPALSTWRKVVNFDEYKESVRAVTASQQNGAVPAPATPRFWKIGGL
jgi:hypothetical protein